MKEVHQKISQFIDDELHPDEMEIFLLDVKKNPELINKIARYQLISQGLKNNNAVVAHDDFLDRVIEGVKQEPHYLLSKQKRKKAFTPTWRKVSLAIAASVSIVGIALTQQTTVSDTTVSQMAQALIETEQKIDVFPVKVATSKKISQHDRFKAYLQAHSDDLYTHGSISVHPLARVASYKQD